VNRGKKKEIGFVELSNSLGKKKKLACRGTFGEKGGNKKCSGKESKEGLWGRGGFGEGAFGCGEQQQFLKKV